MRKVQTLLCSVVMAWMPLSEQSTRSACLCRLEKLDLPRLARDGCVLSSFAYRLSYTSWRSAFPWISVVWHSCILGKIACNCSGRGRCPSQRPWPGACDLAASSWSSRPGMEAVTAAVSRVLDSEMVPPLLDTPAPLLLPAGCAEGL